VGGQEIDQSGGQRDGAASGGAEVKVSAALDAL
jgi:hypothetical protein